MKTFGIIVVSVASGALGAILIMRWCKKKKKCGCGCGDATTTTKTTDAPPISTPGIVADAVTTSEKVLVPQSEVEAAIAADGNGGWIKQPLTWTI